jgi:putative hydrolase of the HAD superfamily
VDAVIFDLDDTLIVEEATARASLAEAIALAGVPSSDGTSTAGPEGSAVGIALECARRHWYRSPYADDCRRLGIASWEGLWASFEGCHPSLDGLEQWTSVYRQAAWEDILRALGADVGRASDVAAGYVAAQRRGHPPIASAVDAARKIGAAVPTGVLTNGPPDIQRLKLSQTGLEFAADAVVISAEVGFGKPESAAFSLALDRLGSRASGTIMVGDSWERDIVGAVNAGMCAVWVGKGRGPPEELDGVMVVDELTPVVFDRL